MTGQWGPPPRRNSPRRWLVPLLVFLTAVAAGAVVVTVVLTDDQVPAVSSASNETTPETTPKPTRTPRPKDRDPAAVTAALRQLDPCQLLDLAVAKQRQVPNAVTVPTGPHTCVLAPSADSLDVRYGLELSVGTFSDQFRRYPQKPIVLAGAKAYELTRDSLCRVSIPVSFVRAIQLSYQQYAGGDLCAVVRQYAEAAVTKLQNPDTAAYGDSAPPFAAWDACSLLGKLTGETDFQPFDEPDTTDLALSSGDLLSGCRTPDDKSRLRILYGPQRHLEGEKSRQVKGKTVLVSGSNPCTATWDQGPSASPVPEYGTASIVLKGKDCATLAEHAMALANQRPDDVEPFHPLLFAPDDNDTGSLGACADLGVTDGQEDCEPYHDVSVPDDPDDIMAAAKADRNVQCAVFKKAVAATFGAEFAPVTWEQHCFYVDNAHTVQIDVNVDPDNRPSDYGADSSLWTEPEETEVAGKAALTFWGVDRDSFDIYLSPYGDLDRRGNLHIEVQMLGGRGKEIGAATPPLPEENAALATTAMTQAVETYFS